MEEKKEGAEREREEEYVRGSQKKEERVKSLDLSLICLFPPPMSHLHVPEEPRVGRRAGVAFMFMFMRACGGHTRTRWGGKKKKSQNASR